MKKKIIIKATQDKAIKGKTPDDRLRENLRANLKKRKAQSRMQRNEKLQTLKGNDLG